MHSAKSTCDLYSKVMEHRKKYEEKGKNPVGDNKNLESSMRKSEMLNQRLTRSIISLSVPRTIERSCEPIVVEYNSNNEDESPPCETQINEYEQEQSNSHNDVVVSPKRFRKDHSSLPAQSEHEARFDSSLNDNDSLVETLKTGKQSIKISKQHKANRLKYIEEAHDRLKTELQQKKNELLMWVD